ncbi:hypothetical protein [Tumebacillus flagellatus]|nr:hypothetical protein [Tumebacillus flagellatus]
MSVWFLLLSIALVVWGYSSLWKKAVSQRLRVTFEQSGVDGPL